MFYNNKKKDLFVLNYIVFLFLILHLPYLEINLYFGIFHKNNKILELILLYQKYFYLKHNKMKEVHMKNFEMYFFFIFILFKIKLNG